MPFRLFNFGRAAEALLTVIESSLEIDVTQLRYHGGEGKGGEALSARRGCRTRNDIKSLMEQ